MRKRLIWTPLAMLLALSTASWAIEPYGSRVVLNPDSVLKVRMNDTVGSDRSKVGDRFTATVQNNEAYGLPDNTRVTGVVTRVRKATKSQLGAIEVDFRGMNLPDGQRYRIAGTPTSLDSKAVETTSDGRMVATASGKKNSSKYIAIGAAGGLLIGSLLGKNVVGALLGAAGGYLYGQHQKKSESREVVLKEGTEFGVRMDQRVAVASTADYRPVRTP